MTIAGRPDASVLIPSYDNRDLVIACLGSLARQTFPVDRFEVVVVIDGSTDGTEQALADLDVPFALEVATQPNRGRAAALNHAARLARAELLIVTDADIVAAPRFVEAHVEAHPASDVVIGPIPLDESSPSSFLTEGVRRWADAHAERMTSPGVRITSSEIYGANLSIPRELFERIGGYREDLRRTEDFHLGKKILDAGLTVGFCPDAVAAQVYDKNFFEWCDDFYQDGRSHAVLVEEFPEEAAGLKIGRYHPQSATKRWLRPRVIHRRLTGNVLLALVKVGMETARRLGLRWGFLLDVQGVVGDALFWRGVRDEIDDPNRFDALTRGPDPR